jgi:hypothetical protein
LILNNQDSVFTLEPSFLRIGMQLITHWLDLADGETADLLRKHGGKTSEELKAESK